MTDDLKSILRKVKALLSKTTERGCTVEEAAQAAAKAQELVDRYRLEMNILDSDAEEIVEAADSIFESGKRVIWKERLGIYLAQANGCYVFLIHGGGGPAKLRVVGKPAATQVTAYLYGYLAKEIDRLATASWKNSPMKAMLSARIYSKSFRLGAVTAIKDRLREQHDRTREEYAQLPEYGQALVRFDGEAAAAKAAAQAQNKNLTTLMQPSQQVYEEAKNAGYRAGKAIPINKGMGNGGVRGHLS